MLKESNGIRILFKIFIVLLSASSHATTPDNQMPVSTENAESIMAVSPIIGSEEYYLEIRRLNSYPPRFPREGILDTKADICNAILKSNYFVDAFDDAYNIPRNHSDEYIGQPPKCSHPDCLDHSNIHVLGHVVEEFVFTCWSEKSKSETEELKFELKMRAIPIFIRGRLWISENKYFVSREYNLFWWSETNAPHYNGRFVFKYNEKREKIVIAIVEKAARNQPSFFRSKEEWSDKVFEYRGKKIVAVTWIHRLLKSFCNCSKFPRVIFDFLAGSKVNDTTLIALSTTMKVRLCTVILSAFQWPYWFSPHQNNTELLSYNGTHLCVPNDYTGSGKLLTLGCRAENIGAAGATPVSFGILQADEGLKEFFAIAKSEDIVVYLTR